MLGLVGLKPGAGAYCASKGAVVLLTKQIAVEYGADKIHCNALCPGCKLAAIPPSEKVLEKGLFSLWSSNVLECLSSICAWLIEMTDLKTPMTAPIYEDEKVREGINALTPWGDWGSADDVAKCAVFLASDDASYVTGLQMVIDGGYTAQ